jgi:hypothetical protein
MSRLLARSVDEKYIKQALTFVKAPEDQLPIMKARCFELLRYVRVIEADIEAGKARHIAGLRPQDRREQFKRWAKQLATIAEELTVFQKPIERFMRDREFYPTHPVGRDEFRQAFAQTFANVLHKDYFKRFGVEPAEWLSKDNSTAKINFDNRAFTIEECAEQIVPEILDLAAGALRQAEKSLAKNTPAGGPRQSVIRNIVLVNAVALWRDIQTSEVKLCYSRGETKFFKFCRAICMALGAGYLCTEDHLRFAVQKFNRRNLR